jgi:hypothetical protein
LKRRSSASLLLSRLDANDPNRRRTFRPASRVGGSDGGCSGNEGGGGEGGNAGTFKEKVRSSALPGDEVEFDLPGGRTSSVTITKGASQIQAR